MKWIPSIALLLPGKQAKEMELLRQRLELALDANDELFIGNQSLKLQLSTTAEALTNARAEASQYRRKVDICKHDLENERKFSTKLRNEIRARSKNQRR